MAAIRRTDTAPELRLRSTLHRLGYRFRKDLRIVVGSASARPDIVFTRQRVAVFVDGCFWHSCPEHSKPPSQNTGYWGPKLQRTIDRDLAQTQLLRDAGWTVIRIWEHDPLDEAVGAVIGVLTTAGEQSRPAAP